mgnify:FL=1
MIPTTCGTGSEGNGFAVLTNPDNGDKKSLRCNAIVAKVSIVDPECMMTMPKKVLASVTFDALCHNIEAYTSKIAQPLTDAMSIYAIELIANNLVSVYNGTGSKKEWENITMASTIGGMVINTAGVTIAHGMEHPASGLKDIVHGQGLAALTPIVIEASYKGNEEKFAKIAKIFGGESAADCADKIRELLKSIDLECKLSDLGIAAEDIPWMAENCMKVSAASIANNPVVFTQEEIADAIGVARSTYTRYESDKRLPDIYKLCALADYFDVSLDDLVGRDWKPKKITKGGTLRSNHSRNAEAFLKR